MTTVQFTLPDQRADSARKAGLLEPGRLEAVVQQLVREHAAAEMRETARRVAALGDADAVSEDEVDDELHAMRAERKALRT